MPQWPGLFGSGLGPEMILLPSMSEDGATLLIHVLHGASGAIDIYIKNLGDDSAFTPIVQGIAATFMAEAEGGQLFIHTNWQAPLDNNAFTSVNLASGPDSGTVSGAGLIDATNGTSRQIQLGLKLTF